MVFKNSKYLQSPNGNFIRNYFSTIINSLWLFVFQAYFPQEITQTVSGKNSDMPVPSKSMQMLMSYVSEYTPKDAVFIQPGKDYPLSFIRTTNREKLVISKFTPTQSRTIYKWYNRWQLNEALETDIIIIDSIAGKYKIDYMIDSLNVNHASLQLEKAFDNLGLYKILD